MNPHQRLCSRGRANHRARLGRAASAVQSPQQPAQKESPLHVMVPADREKRAPFGHLSPLVPIGTLRAFESSLSAARVLEDTKNGLKSFVTASMDKSIAAFRLTPNDQPLPPADPWLSSDTPSLSGLHDLTLPPPTYTVEFQKIPAPGGPIFSIAPSRPAASQTSPPGSPPLSNRIFCGNASKEVVSWEPFTPSFDVSLRLAEHTGWVRAVATYDKFLFSCGCNVLRQWDMTFATPKEINTVKLFTGDILSIAVGKGFVFTSGADGSIRGWTVDKLSGEMRESAAVERAHGEGHRVYQLTLHSGSLYSCASDGSIKRWTQQELKLVSEVSHAHGGEKVRCMAVAGNGVLYTGGDDKMIRAWTLVPLPPQPTPPSLECAEPTAEAVLTPPQPSEAILPSPAPLVSAPGGPLVSAPGGPLQSLVLPLNRFKPLQAHATSVRSLVAGASELIVSGDKDGFLSIFRAEGAPTLTPKQAPTFPSLSPPPSPPTSSSTPSASTRDIAVKSILGVEAVSGDLEPPALATIDRVEADEFEASLNPTPPVSPPVVESLFGSVDEGGWLYDLASSEALQDEQDLTEALPPPSAAPLALAQSGPDLGPAPSALASPGSASVPGPAPSAVAGLEAEISPPPKAKSVFVDLPPE